jgi:hypothetical protein
MPTDRSTFSVMAMSGTRMLMDLSLEVRGVGGNRAGLSKPSNQEARTTRKVSKRERPLAPAFAPT